MESEAKWPQIERIFENAYWVITKSKCTVLVNIATKWSRREESPQLINWMIMMMTHFRFTKMLWWWRQWKQPNFVGDYRELGLCFYGLRNLVPFLEVCFVRTPGSCVLLGGGTWDSWIRDQWFSDQSPTVVSQNMYRYMLPTFSQSQPWSTQSEMKDR